MRTVWLPFADLPWKSQPWLPATWSEFLSCSHFWLPTQVRGNFSAGDRENNSAHHVPFSFSDPGVSSFFQVPLARLWCLRNLYCPCILEGQRHSSIGSSTGAVTILKYARWVQQKPYEVHQGLIGSTSSRVPEILALFLGFLLGAQPKNKAEYYGAL
jgi:hypothetical protein